MKNDTHPGFPKIRNKAPKDREPLTLYCSLGCQARGINLSVFSGGERNTLNILNVRHRHGRTKGAQERSTRDSTVKAERLLLSQ